MLDAAREHPLPARSHARRRLQHAERDRRAVRGGHPAGRARHPGARGSAGRVRNAGTRSAVRGQRRQAGRDRRSGGCGARCWRPCGGIRWGGRRGHRDSDRRPSRHGDDADGASARRELWTCSPAISCPGSADHARDGNRQFGPRRRPDESIATGPWKVACASANWRRGSVLRFCLSAGSGTTEPLAGICPANGQCGEPVPIRRAECGSPRSCRRRELEFLHGVKT